MFVGMDWLALLLLGRWGECLPVANQPILF
jgi:hypothetical protein